MLAIMGTDRKNQKKFKNMTILEIKEQLDKLGIEYNKKATKEDLLTLLPQKG